MEAQKKLLTKKRIIITILILMVAGATGVYSSIDRRPTIEDVCKLHPEFKNIYGFSELDFKIISTAHSVSDHMQFKTAEPYQKPSDLLRQFWEHGTGQCDTYTLVLGQCLDRIGVKHIMLHVEVDELNQFHHSFIMLEDGRYIDATLNDIDMILLFQNGSANSNFWVWLDQTNNSFGTMNRLEQP